MIDTPIEQALSHAWLLLAGSQVTFARRQQPGVQLNAQRYYVVSVKFSREGDRGGVGLLLSEEDARDLTASMFGKPPREVSEDEVSDACGEMCNVMAGSIEPLFVNHPEVELGLPQSLLPEEFIQISKSSHVDGVFEGHHQGRDITIIVFDPLLMPGDHPKRPLPLSENRRGQK